MNYSLLSFLGVGFLCAGCLVDSGFLDGMPCGEGNTCQGGYECVRQECPDQPGYLCPVCRKTPVDHEEDGGLPDGGDDGGVDAADTGGDRPLTCDQNPPACKTVPDCQDAQAECQNGVWTCPAGFESVERSCDGVDNDCDGETDRNLVCVLAGTGESGFQDGAGPTARFNLPRALAQHPSGGVVVADSGNHVLRWVRADGSVSTIAGTGNAGSDDGAALSSTFHEPSGLAKAADGSFFIADRLNHKIRVLSPDNTVSTAAGSGMGGYLDGAAVDARFAMPSGVAVTQEGTIYVADSSNHCIRKISADVVTTFAGRCGEPGNLDAVGQAARFNLPTDVYLLSDGTLVVTEESNHKVRRIATDGTVTTWAGTGQGGFRDGPLAQAMFKKPAGCLSQSGGILLVADRANHRVRAVGASGVATYLGAGTAGMDGGPPQLATFSSPSALAYLENGHLVIADSQNHCLRVVLP